jgi:hypothetical protein
VSEINVSHDSSDIPVIVEALTFKKAALKRTASKKRAAEQEALVVQIDLLINTFNSIRPNPRGES